MNPHRVGLYYIAETWVNPHMLLLQARHSDRENRPVMEICNGGGGGGRVIRKVESRSSGMKAAL